MIGLLLWFLHFTRLHSAAGRDIAAATANAPALQSTEHAVHVDIERSANDRLAGHLVLSHLAVYLYRLCYAVIVGVLLWVFIRHSDVYRKVRRTLVAMMVPVLPVYRAAPMSPPRFAPPGAVDIVATYDIPGHASRDTGDGQNHYSATPSPHVGLVVVVRVRPVVCAPGRTSTPGAATVASHRPRRAGNPDAPPVSGWYTPARSLTALKVVHPQVRSTSPASGSHNG